MKLNNSLSFEEVKELIKTVVEEESKRYGFNINCKAINPIYIYKENLSQKTKLITYYKATISVLPYYGIQTKNKSNISIALVFLNRYKSHIFNTNNIFEYLYTAYHEIRHILQEETKIKPDINRLSIIMQELTDYTTVDYYINHDSFSFEIDAIEYGIIMAEKLLKNNGLYEENIGVIEKKKTTLEIEKIKFDFDNIFEKLDKNIKQYKAKNEIYTNAEGMYLIDTLYNDDFSLRTIDEIINNTYFNFLDEQTRYKILSSNAILNSLNGQLISDAAKIELENAYLYYIKEQNQKLAKINNLKQNINSKKLNEKTQEKIARNIYKKTTNVLSLIELNDEKDYITKCLEAKKELFYESVKSNKTR